MQDNPQNVARSWAEKFRKDASSIEHDANVYCEEDGSALHTIRMLVSRGLNTVADELELLAAEIEIEEELKEHE
jgi:hypothetical protein